MLDGHGEALADGSPVPRRIVTYFWGNGVHLPSWVPTQTGAGFALPASLELLEPVKSRVRIVSGLSNHGGASGHEEGIHSTLQGGDSGGETVDQAAIAHLGNPRFASLQYGLSRHNKSGKFKQNLSFGPGASAIPPELDPVAAFDRLFGGGGGPSPGGGLPERPSRWLERRKSILDAVEADLGRLVPTLSGSDRIRLEGHLDAIRALEKSLSGGSGGGSTAVDCKALEPLPAVTDVQTISRQFNQLIALALACDQTRVVSHLVGGCQCLDLMSWLTLPGATEDWHDSSHGGGWEERMAAIVRWVVGELADLVAQLDGIGEGSGTLLDHTIVLATSETSSADDHGGDDMPILVAGGPGVTGGYHWRGEGETSGVPLGILQALGADVGQFGQATKPIPLG
jgi:hypothetical protein